VAIASCALLIALAGTVASLFSVSEGVMAGALDPAAGVVAVAGGGAVFTVGVATVDFGGLAGATAGCTMNRCQAK
jgi:hypothetical protein